MQENYQLQKVSIYRKVTKDFSDKQIFSVFIDYNQQYLLKNYLPIRKYFRNLLGCNY
jgi:hypothetical protein